jgi:SET domain-containing protein
MMGTTPYNEWIEFRGSGIHGQGGFARKDIPAGTRLIEYVGERISKDESVRRCEANNHFIFTLTDQEDLDGDVPWNPARLINHSCEPNAEAEFDPGDQRIWIIAHRVIPAGHEITFNYGYDLEDYRSYPCRCGAETCVGYIVAEEFHEHVRRQNGLADEPK